MKLHSQFPSISLRHPHDAPSSVVNSILARNGSPNLGNTDDSLNGPSPQFLNSFLHLFSGGYAANYYSYLFAEVMSADAFAAFEEAGLKDTAAMTRLGGQFRDTVLGLGGGVDAGEVFKRFRGRAPTHDALLGHLGLKD